MERDESSAAESHDFAILRRYLGGRNLDSYRVNRETLTMIPDSYVKQVSHAEAIAALGRLEAKYGYA